ncbi:hypothetical protein ACFXPX_12430 [Kitasatospora sp. NPDC059146]|uniref:hypothetical protein n=1 Tax=unclassified Kitasatospora TaxID=2633591 RepID=UPI0036AE4C9D
MLRSMVARRARAAVAGAVVLAGVSGLFAVAAGDPVRHGSPAAPPSACGGSADVQCLANKVAWNGTGLIIWQR